MLASWNVPMDCQPPGFFLGADCYDCYVGDLYGYPGYSAENRAIAALAVIVEDEDKGKKRLTHDATHGIRVNHRIKCRDKIRAPGAREKKQILLETLDRGEVAFSIVGDISKAHRRFKHSEDEQGFLGCQLGARDTWRG